MRAALPLCLTIALLLALGACDSGGALPLPQPGPSSIHEPGGLPRGYELVWSDEFDQSGAPNPTKWDYDQVGTSGVGNHDRWGNNEQQFYSRNRPENARVENGVLIIEARREDVEREPDYSSARLVTNRRQTWRYGYFEVRAKLACGVGVWPAIWTLSAPPHIVWPDDGEIDIMEHFGFTTAASDSGAVTAAVHTAAFNHMQGNHRSATATPDADPCTTFHLYQMTWTPDRISVGVDGLNYFQYSNDGSGDAEWPFDSPQYLIMNVAVGGNWFGGRQVDDSAFPARMEIDYVRVYQTRRSTEGELR